MEAKIISVGAEGSGIVNPDPVFLYMDSAVTYEVEKVTRAQLFDLIEATVTQERVEPTKRIANSLLRDLSNRMRVRAKDFSAEFGKHFSVVPNGHTYQRDYYDPSKNEYVVVCSCGTACSVPSSGTPSADREGAFMRWNLHAEGHNVSK